jgi:agmatine deiminase
VPLRADNRDHLGKQLCPLRKPANYVIFFTSTPCYYVIDLIEMHMPEACEVPGWRLPVLPASYVNYLLVNHGVIVPQFRQKKNDQRALAIIQEIFPDREVVGIDCLDLVEEGGTLHCISQQQPA